MEGVEVDAVTQKLGEMQMGVESRNAGEMWGGGGDHSAADGGGRRQLNP